MYLPDIPPGSAMSMHAILPVLDLYAGQVVHAIRGERQHYHPISSRLTSSTKPLHVAKAIRDHYGFNDLYLADLDAIAGKTPDFPLYEALVQEGFSLWVDAGILTLSTAIMVQACGVAKVIIALETCPAPLLMDAILSRLGTDTIVFSLDLRAGMPLAPDPGWEADTVVDLATDIYRRGIRQMILLDLMQVGTGQGTGTTDLCQQLHQRLPELSIITGGGIRTIADVDEQLSHGATRVLVATALHQGTLF